MSNSFAGPLVTIIGGIILLMISVALIRSGLKIVGTFISIIVLLLLAMGVLMFMGVIPMPVFD